MLYQWFHIKKLDVKPVLYLSPGNLIITIRKIYDIKTHNNRDEISFDTSGMHINNLKYIHIARLSLSFFLSDKLNFQYH